MWNPEDCGTQGGFRMGLGQYPPNMLAEPGPRVRLGEDAANVPIQGGSASERSRSCERGKGGSQNRSVSSQGRARMHRGGMDPGFIKQLYQVMEWMGI